jgi:aspartokinase/homoserine dehydrogenase 1
MKVMKFGGSSVGDADCFRRVAEIIERAVKEDGCIVVLSAMQGTTDALIEIGQLAADGDETFREKIKAVEAKHSGVVLELIPTEEQSSLLSFVKKNITELESICEGVFLLRELSRRTLDRIMSFGEILSSNILSKHLNSLRAANSCKDSREVILTNSNFGFAAVDFETTYQRINEYIESLTAKLHVVPGFIASDSEGNTTTLGRGGADYSAAIFAAAIGAEVLEIWTDVSGMMTANPKLVRASRAIARLSYQEAMELSHFGARVIYPPTIQPVMSKNIPVWIKNTFAPDDHGTLIENKLFDESKKFVRGISSIDGMSILSLEGSGMVGIPGFSKRLFEALSNAKINVILITQSSSEHSICVAVEEKDALRAKQAVDAEFEYEISVNKVEPLKVELGLSVLALVGDNMKSHSGISGKMFGALGHNGINIHAIAQGSSERNISAVIRSSDVKKAVNVLHEEFFAPEGKQINLFVVGVGNVGSRLLEQIRQQKNYLFEKLGLNLRVVGVANSRKLLFDEGGTDLHNWRQLLADAPATSLSEVTDLILRQNLRNTIFVDTTASKDVADVYESLLKKSVSVVACNKIACSSDYERYALLKDLAREFSASFLFETNVGAGLPVINTLNDLMQSGDSINRIEAVLSGTLNYVFNNYDGTRSFASVVRQAQKEGYTEPDPRLDLSGTDVARKILILAREAGYKIEIDDVKNEQFLPASCLQGDVEDFYNEMERNEAYFQELYQKAKRADLILKYIATFENGKASVGLHRISKEHNFYNLSGKDNAILYYTNRYEIQPLVVKGAGAGAEVTAAGVFADIIRSARV